jgi:large subunit ribosomal protein L15
MNLSNIKPSSGSTKNRKRVGRGPGSGHGKQSTQGAKGQKGSSGYKSRSWSEGGQMPLQRRIPKRGFRNLFRVDYQEINLEALAKIDAPEINLDTLKANGLLKRHNKLVKILGDGEVSKALTIKAHAFSASAKEKIEKAGGKAELITRPGASKDDKK